MENMTFRSQKQNTLLFISLGSLSYHRQTILSILSVVWYLKRRPDHNIRIILYTDNVGFSMRYLRYYDFISIIALTHERIKEMKGPYNYIFRVKIMAILDVLSNGCKKLCYLDGDTFFRSDPLVLFEEINENRVLMYKREGILGDKGHYDWEIIRRKLPSLALYINNEKFNIGLEDYMWNAGVIGVMECHKDLVERVKALTDQYCSVTDKNAYHQDQLMFSLVFARSVKMDEAEKYGIYHYCYQYQKFNSNIIIKKFFWRARHKSKDELNELVHEISLRDIQFSPIPLPLCRRPGAFFSRRVQGLKWAIERVRKSGNLKSFFDRGKQY